MNGAASPSATGVLVMAHGTPTSPEGIEAFYTSIRRGRPPPPELLAELEDRYRAIGGVSPLTRITRSQVAGVSAALEARAPGRFRVAYGAKHVRPTIEEGTTRLIAEGARPIVALVLTPHESTVGSDAYLERAAAAASASGVEVVAVPSWHRVEGLADLLAQRTATALDGLAADERRQVTVLFTAHSVPQRTLTDGDPYARQVAESAADVAQRIGLDHSTGGSWGVAWQSAGRTPEPWLGPDLRTEIARAADTGATAVVVCPVGFVADHLEVLYDLDVEAAGVAASCGVAFARTASLNDDPLFFDLLAGVVERAADPVEPGNGSPPAATVPPQGGDG